MGRLWQIKTKTKRREISKVLKFGLWYCPKIDTIDTFTILVIDFVRTLDRILQLAVLCQVDCFVLFA